MTIIYEATFDSDLESWVNVGSYLTTWESDGGNGVLNNDRNGAGFDTSNGSESPSIAVINGVDYTLDYVISDVRENGFEPVVRIIGYSASDRGGQIFAFISDPIAEGTGGISGTIEFTATSSELYIFLRLTGSANGEVLYDSLIVTQVSDTDLLDLKVEIGQTSSDLLDNKAIVANDDINLLDLLVAPFKESTDFLDNKIVVTASAVNLLDLQIEAALSFNVTTLLHAKVIVANSTADLLDGKVQIADTDIDLLSFKIIAATDETFLLDLKSIISTADADTLDIKLTVGNTNLIIIKRHVGGFSSGKSVQWRLWNTDTIETITPAIYNPNAAGWTTEGTKEIPLVGGISDYFVGITHSTGETQLLLQWNEIGTNKGASEPINLQDLFAIESIKYLEGKQITNPTTGQQLIYERDGITIFKQADISEDEDGIVPYDDNSTEINRRERLE